MSIIRRYKKINTDLDSLSKDILEELRKKKELNIKNEIEGESKDGTIFISITGVRASIPENVEGELRESTITIIGRSNDYIVEIHTGCWGEGFVSIDENENFPKHPDNIGGIVSVTNFGLEILKRIDELVRKNSERTLSFDNVETFHS